MPRSARSRESRSSQFTTSQKLLERGLELLGMLKEDAANLGAEDVHRFGHHVGLPAQGTRGRGQFLDHGDTAGVEPVERLVEQPDGRLLPDQPRQGRTFALAGGQETDRNLFQSAQAQAGQGIVRRAIQPLPEGQCLAQRQVRIERGTLADYLGSAEGGLKGVVATERRQRREEAGKQVEDEGDVRAQLARKLRELDEIMLEALSAEGPEFSLVMVRRDGNGNLALIGEIADDIALIERAGKRLVG